MAGSYIVAGARTPIGKMSGALSSFSAADLGGFAIKAALERAGVKPEEVDEVIMGCAAFYPYAEEEMAELACLAVMPEYRRHGYGEQILSYVEGRARAERMKRRRGEADGQAPA